MTSDDFWVDGDYHLGAESPCIDTGDSASPELPPSDFEGDPRIVDGDNDVDGADLVAVSSGSVVLAAAVIAEEFGRINCL